jgi:L-ascorbate metabolism protein UlaG (beta-lactamase superfamily)
VNKIRSHVGDAQTFWNQPDLATPSLFWLGQAGFALRGQGLRMLIDPYLSDSLEKKYAGTDKPHPRMMPAPFQPENLQSLDGVLCSHRHTDHMDPETLTCLAKVNPQCRFVVPASERTAAIEMGLAEDRLVPVDAGQEIELATDVTLTVVPAAHETRDLDDQGRHRFLGFILQCGEFTFYHSGDTIPFPGLEESLSGKEIDLALLPVNGRGKGVAGNFTFSEAMTLCHNVGIPQLVPHHFDMFTFNTVDRAELAAQMVKEVSPLCHLPDTNSWLQFNAK